MIWKKRKEISFLFLLSTVNYRIVKGKKGFFHLQFVLLRERKREMFVFDKSSGDFHWPFKKTKNQKIWCFSLSNNLPGTPSTKLPLSVSFLQVWRALYPTTSKSHTLTNTQTLFNKKFKNWEQHRCFCFCVGAKMLWRSIGDGQWQPTDELDGHVSVWGGASSSTQKWGNFSLLPVCVPPFFQVKCYTRSKANVA